MPAAAVTNLTPLTTLWVKIRAKPGASMQRAVYPAWHGQIQGSELVSAPTLPWEVGNSLTALFKRARIDLDQAMGALQSFREIPVRLAEIDLESSVEMAREEGIYAYDAYMLECARKYRAPLLSRKEILAAIRESRERAAGQRSA